jgi:hypothetical protein
MKAPSDPIAFSRFTEGLSASGDPDYDPRALLTADASPGNDMEVPDRPAPTSAVALPAPAFAASIQAQSAIARQASEDYPYLGYTIVDIPNAYPGPALSDGKEKTEKVENEANWDDYWNYAAEGARESSSPESTLYPVWAQGGSVGPIDGPDIVKRTEPREILAGEEALNAQVRQSVPNNPVEPVPYTPPVKQNAPDSLDGGSRDLALLPTEQRPPESASGYAIPPEAFIGSIERRPPAQVPVPVQTPPAYPEQPAGAGQALPPPTPPGNPPDYMDESLFIGPIKAPAETGLAPEKQVPEPEFPVPVISELERGKYYLQLGSYSRSDLVKNALAKIDKSYPLAVQTQGYPGEPAYRLLVGPVNQGESAALLQRFKRDGFWDAFVKSN